MYGICRDGEIGKHAGLKIQCPGKGLQVRFLFSVQPFVIKDICLLIIFLSGDFLIILLFGIGRRVDGLFFYFTV